MPHFNQSNYSSSSENSHSSRNLNLAAYARPIQEESLYQLWSMPFNPDPCLYPRPSPADPDYHSSIVPPTPSPNRPLTRSLLPRDCLQEFAIPPRYKNQKPKLDMWGGPCSFYPIALPNNKGVLGTPLRDCLEGFGLKEPEERLFGSWASTGKSHIDFLIMWPGYPQLDWIAPISIYGPDSLLVTKRVFAYRVALEYQKFVLMCERNQLECQNPRWRVGPGGYTLDRMRLSTIYWVDKDIWQAYISVLTDRDVDPNGLKPMRDISRG